MTKTVAILGASENPERYAYKAYKMLSEYGHPTVLVSPNLKELDGQAVFTSLGKITEPIDTVTVYVGPKISSQLAADFLKLKPRRVIFNPGSENPDLEKDLKQAGVHVVEACTLVLLRANQFEIA